MQRKVFKTGNSLVVSLPKEIGNHWEFLMDRMFPWNWIVTRDRSRFAPPAGWNNPVWMRNLPGRSVNSSKNTGLR